MDNALQLDLRIAASAAAGTLNLSAAMAAWTVARGDYESDLAPAAITASACGGSTAMTSWAFAGHLSLSL